MKLNGTLSFVAGIAVGASFFFYSALQKQKDREQMNVLIQQAVEERLAQQEPVPGESPAQARARAEAEILAEKGGARQPGSAEDVSRAFENASSGSDSGITTGGVAIEPASASKQGRSGSDSREIPDWYKKLSPEQRQQIADMAVSAATGLDLAQAAPGSGIFENQLAALESTVSTIQSEVKQATGQDTPLFLDEGKIDSAAQAAVKRGDIKPSEVELYKDGLRAEQTVSVFQGKEFGEMNWGIGLESQGE